MFLYIITIVRSYCYNFWLGNPLLNISTPQLYRDMLEIVKPNSRLLEVGCGTCMPILRNMNTIRRKNLSIHGIDIDQQYIDICSQQIKDIGDERIQIEKRDLFTIDNKYDYVVFSESYPVIPEQLMTKMITYSRTLLNQNGRIIFVHNLVRNDQKDHPIALLKPFIKYIPFVWVDFGKATTVESFEQWISDNNLLIHSKEILVNTKIPVVFGEYNIEQYIYIVS